MNYTGKIIYIDDNIIIAYIHQKNDICIIDVEYEMIKDLTLDFGDEIDLFGTTMKNNKYKSDKRTMISNITSFKKVYSVQFISDKI